MKTEKCCPLVLIEKYNALSFIILTMIDYLKSLTPVARATVPTCELIIRMTCSLIQPAYSGIGYSLYQRAN